MLATISPGASEMIPAAHFAPDESDLVDSSDLQGMSIPLRNAPDHGADVVAGRDSSGRGASPSPHACGSRPPALRHGLIPVSSRFWFGIFAEEEMPDVDSLNQGGGLCAAEFPTDLDTHARPPSLHWFCIDEDLVYLSFSNDWGPLNVAMFYRFCVHVHQMLIDKDMEPMHLALYTSTQPHHKANAALLCALYSMTIDHIRPADAFHPFSEVCTRRAQRSPQIEFMPFRDAGYGRADYALTMQDILYGMRRALDHKLLDLTTFDLESYEHYEQVHNGDWNWITPQFLAFASPKDRAYMAALAAGGPHLATSSACYRTPNPLLRNTVQYFQEHKVSAVVRLNNPLYNSRVFEDAGIRHLVRARARGRLADRQDMYFDDGSNPSDHIIRAFITEADAAIRVGGTIAVHCKAGLGRTGVLIGAYLIWRYGFTASEVIGFMRLMRPGCVVGPQQHFMYENAATWLRWGVEDRLRAQWSKELKERDVNAAAPRTSPTTAVPPKTPASKRSNEGPGTGDENRSPAVPRSAKPTPCVGQPRKSPSPKRRRVLDAGAREPSEEAPSLAQGTVAHDNAPSSQRIASEDQSDAKAVELLTPGGARKVEARVSRTDEEVRVSRTDEEVQVSQTDEEVLGVMEPAALPNTTARSSPRPQHASSRAVSPARTAAVCAARARQARVSPGPVGVDARPNARPTTSSVPATAPRALNGARPVRPTVATGDAKPALARAHVRLTGRSETENQPPARVPTAATRAPTVARHTASSTARAAAARGTTRFRP
ncbi:hypothetical protein MSPP1_002821 [Malassezia sp. CBS 17886]|nr:hypothetical protein MSPP1_002821 [Malassezia sp. CBS 17886]